MLFSRPGVVAASGLPDAFRLKTTVMSAEGLVLKDLRTKFGQQ
ncbi:hypothetical protein HALLA_03190 (plasmid) [Halostagnicola larsenii XH-48]|uniref:Uncharacterized protein n=1 Tax=Halostagnicola larsenii XH-48 TaxID=797299 RepID=W0JVY8_9EURY|nr:hypothetical protein HALLA_03190 [Halostagnicola larsenii XH-48]